MAKILIVDDNEEILSLYRYILSSEQFEVLTVDNGNDALLLAASESPDLILLDVAMPGMDGAETARLLAGSEKTRNIPTVFLTCLIEENEVSRGTGKIGGKLYISKSAEKNEIIARIKEILKDKK
jgi:DNA-binding response OmpR family regulator